MKAPLLLGALALLPTTTANAALPALALDCPGRVMDFDGDGVVGNTVTDLILFFQAWSAGDPRADLNFDLSVDVSDLTHVYPLYQSGSFTVLDMNHDGATDTADPKAFWTLWFGGDGRADVNRDLSVDISDLVHFAQTWSAGCS